MCGRYALRRKERLQQYLQATFEEFDEHGRSLPKYNIAPSQHVPIARLHEAKRILDIASWGFVPSWAKEKPKSKPINARSETVATSGLFRSAFAKTRCLVPADGFYEWKAGTPKQPFFIHQPTDDLFAFAGLWSRWENQTTCIILTTTPNPLMRPIHDRMPVILNPTDYSDWLNPATPPQRLQLLLAPYAGDLQAYPVTTHVNRPANDDPQCIAPLNAA